MKVLLLLKPDAVRRQLIGTLINRLSPFCQYLEMRMETMTRALAETHYAIHAAKPFFAELIDNMSGKRVVAIVADIGIIPVEVLRNYVKELRDEYHDPFAKGSENLIHCSDSEQTAAKEIELWFPANWLAIRLGGEVMQMADGGICVVADDPGTLRSAGF